MSYAIAYFLRNFPGYTVDTLLNEYACRFYVLMKQSYKIDAGNALEQIHIMSIPNYEKPADKEKAMNFYLEIATDEQPKGRLISVLKTRKNGPIEKK